MNLGLLIKHLLHCILHLHVRQLPNTRFSFPVRATHIPLKFDQFYLIDILSYLKKKKFLFLKRFEILQHEKHNISIFVLSMKNLISNLFSSRQVDHVAT